MLLLFPLGLTSDQVVWYSFICTVVAAVTGSLAVYLNIHFGRKSLTKRDLEPLEQHTAATSGHLAKQREREELRTIASRASITLTGRNYSDEPLLVYIVTADKQVTLTSVDLISGEDDTKHGSSPCNKLGSTTYSASLNETKLRGWFEAGKAINASEVRLRLRIHLTMEGRSEMKVIPVVLGTFNVGDDRKPDMPPTRVWEITGAV